MSLLAIGADPEANAEPIDLYVVADRMQSRGWRFDRQQNPPSLHLTVSPAHDVLVERFLEDLREAVSFVRTTGAEAEGASAMYGMLGQLPDRAFVREALLDFMDGMDAMYEPPAAATDP
jgi:hypothetical protein